MRRRRVTPRRDAPRRAPATARRDAHAAETRDASIAMEYVSFEGLRADGRRANECRRVRHEFAVDADADGSARFEIGNTVVQATVRGPRERRGGRAEEGASDACAVTATYAASGGGGGRRERTTKGGSKGALARGDADENTG